jgi:hypothetical protein
MEFFHSLVRPMNRILKWFATTIVGCGIIAYGISFVWPSYDWDLRVPSPDGRYDIVVLRGNAAAFADYSYEIYLFPHAEVPHDRAKTTRVWLTPIWRGSKYLIYSGYSYPMFRWCGNHSIEIDLDEAYYEHFILEPVKRFKGSDDAILVSVVFGKEDKTNVRP